MWKASVHALALRVEQRAGQHYFFGSLSPLFPVFTRLAKQGLALLAVGVWVLS